jgi:hypothetical protein
VGDAVEVVSARFRPDRAPSRISSAITFAESESPAQGIETVFETVPFKVVHLVE